MLTYEAATVSRIPSYTPDGGLQINTRYKVTPGSAVTAFIQRLAGGPRLLGNRIVFARPHADPECPWLYASDVTSEPFDGDVPTLGANDNSLTVPAFYSAGMFVSCTYKLPKFDQQDGGESNDSGDQPETPSSSETEEIELASNSWEFSAQAQKVPTQRLGWNDDLPGAAPTDAIDGLVNVSGADQAVWVLPQIQVTTVRHYCPRRPTSAITTLAGRINKSAFRVAEDTWPAETLRFDGASATRRYTNKGFKFYEITYKFAVFPVYDRITGGVPPVIDYVGWNRKYDFKTGKWRYVRWASNKTRGLFLLDEDAPSQKFGNRELKGFGLLFHPQAT